MFSKKPAAFAATIVFLSVLGCGPSQPAAVTNAVVTIEGQPNEEVFVSIDTSVVEIDGGTTRVSGKGPYGVRVLNDKGTLEISVNEIVAPEPLHGFVVTLVNLNDQTVKLTVDADGHEQEVSVATKTLDYADIQIGYKQEHEPGSPMAHDPKDSVYEAQEYLKRKEAKGKNPEGPRQLTDGVQIERLN